MRIASGVALFIFGVAAAAAFEWGHYANARFAYSIDIPPEFSPVAEADNGDGGMSYSQDKLSQLAIWGANLGENTLAQDFAERLASAEADGWTISYRRETPGWASWSGSQQGRIFYTRAIALCDGQAAYFLIEYPKARKESFGPIVSRLVKSLQNMRSC